MSVKTDVVVIGAGPVGSLAARQLARKGLSVTLFEEHKEVGRPVHCAGLIGINGLHQIGVLPSSKVVIRRVAQSIFHAPGTAQLVFDKGEPHAYVLHRDLLDQQLAGEAQAAGANLELETRVTQCIPIHGGMRVTVVHKRQKREVNTRFVVNAEGIGARLGVHQGLPRLNQEHQLPALQYEVSNVSVPPNAVHLYFDSQIASKFFAWIIPLENNRARIGLATAHRNPRQALEKFRNRHAILADAKVETRFGGVVYTGGPISRTISKRFVNIGDAAGQVKATTGGGVVAGGNCAVMAAHQIVASLTTGNYRHRLLIDYERRWKRSWGRQLWLMATLRRVLNLLDNRELDALFENLQGTNVRELVESKGDIDHQGRIITRALASPTMWKSVLVLLFRKARYLPRLLWS
jgi:geranylgeranyl reductase family protein